MCKFEDRTSRNLWNPYWEGTKVLFSLKSRKSYIHCSNYSVLYIMKDALEIFRLVNEWSCRGMCCVSDSVSEGSSWSVNRERCSLYSCINIRDGLSDFGKGPSVKFDLIWCVLICSVVNFPLTFYTRFSQDWLYDLLILNRFMVFHKYNWTGKRSLFFSSTLHQNSLWKNLVFSFTISGATLTLMPNFRFTQEFYSLCTFISRHLNYIY